MRHVLSGIIILTAGLLAIACSGFSEFARGVDEANRSANTAQSIANDPIGNMHTQNAADNAVSDAENAPLDEPASCCINDQFYSCGTLAALHRCSGQPMELISCSDRCTMGDLRCEDSCLQAYGPNPSQCGRVPARDGECGN